MEDQKHSLTFYIGNCETENSNGRRLMECSKDPIKISKAYSVDSEWRNRATFVNGREEIQEFLNKKWKTELDYKLKKEYWAHTDHKIAVRFEYEYRTENGQWFRSYGNENWEFDKNGLIKKWFASINDLAINESERTL